MNKLAQFIYEYEKQISDEDFVESEAKERISQIKTIDDVKELSNSEMENIIIDYNYVTEDTESDTLLNIFKYLTKFEDNKEEFFGVVGDDYIAY